MTDYDLPEEIPGADKALDLVKMGTDKLFNLAWRYMAYKHRRDEVTFIFLEHARAFTEETIMLLHSGADVPTVGERSVIVGPVSSPGKMPCSANGRASTRSPPAGWPGDDFQGSWT